VTLLAVLAATWLVARRAPDTGLACLAPIIALAVLAGARVFYWSLDGGRLVGPGGLASMGGVLAGLALARPLAWWAAVPVPMVVDALVPSALLALGIGRIGCFLAGCCYGVPTTAPWGVVFPELGEAPRHPLQLYAAVVDLAIVYAVCRRSAAAGVTAARALAAFAVGRFALETLRDPGATDYLAAIGLTLPQVLCVLLLLGVRPFLRRSIEGTLPQSMKIVVPLVLLVGIGVALPAAAIDPDFEATLAVRPARGALDVATGFGSLHVRRWRLTPAADSDGIDPAAEPIVLVLGRDEVVLPAGAVTADEAGRRYVFRDDTVTHGLTRLRLKRRKDGAWLVSFRTVGMDLTRLVTQYPLCEVLALAIGNDEGSSGVDLDRPRGVASPRLKLRGFCEVEQCLQTIRPRHVVCP
jgi:phosphatidylglycerol:prolipoprotein diacylglycerol transferase